MNTIKYALLLVATLVSAQSMAQDTVQCVSNDCLNQGYELRDANNDLIEVGLCNGADCNQLGWDIFNVNGQTTVVVCSDNSCFGKGFQELDPLNNNEMIRTRTCADGDTGTPDCLAHGWDDDYSIDGRKEQVSCTDGVSCLNGFVIETVIDNTAQMQADIQALKDAIRAKKQELRQYIRQYHRINFSLLRDIFRLKREKRKLRRELRQTGGQTVVDTKEAICLSPGGCFTSGYTIN